jgi:hypothetical protein
LVAVRPRIGAEQLVLCLLEPEWCAKLGEDLRRLGEWLGCLPALAESSLGVAGEDEGAATVEGVAAGGESVCCCGRERSCLGGIAAAEE